MRPACARAPAERPGAGETMRRAAAALVVVLGVLGGMLGQSACAQGSAPWPQRPLRILVTFPPGGGTDILARLIAQEISPLLGQPVLVENRPGGNGSIASEAVARSAPDGLTLLMVTSSFAINAVVLQGLPFDTARDFLPVTLVATTPLMIAITPTMSARNVAEFVALLKSRPGTLAYTSCGNGSPQQLAGEMFKMMTGTDMAHVPYKGCAPALTDVLAGVAPVAINTAANILPHAQQGRLRVLGVTSRTRIAVAPEVPTIAEQGLPGYEVDQWFGLMAPAQTPLPIADRIHAAVSQGLSRKAVQEKLLAQGFAPGISTPREAAAILAADLERFGRLARTIGLKVD